MQKEYTDNAKKALALAKKVSGQLHNQYIGTEHILVGLLREKNGTAANVLMENQVDEEKLLSLIEKLIAPDGGLLLMEPGGYTPSAQHVLEQAREEAERFQSERVGTEHILIALLKEQESTGARLLNTLEKNPRKLYVEILVAMGQDALHAVDEEHRPAEAGNEPGSTPYLARYSRDLTQMAREDRLDPVVGREKEIRRMIRILCRRGKNNPCLIGEPGVGKTAIVEGLAACIARGEVPEGIRDKRVLTLDLSGMVAGTKYRGEFEERIKRVIKEVASDGSILLFLDEIHTIIGAGGAEGALDAANILKPALSRGELQLIGATTITEYRKHIEKDAALERRFQPVMVEEPDVPMTEMILKGLRSRYEAHHHVEITDDAVAGAAEMSARYINDRFLPDKAIDLMDEACARVRLKNFHGTDAGQSRAECMRECEHQLEKALRRTDLEQAAALKRELSQLQEAEKRAQARQKRAGREKMPSVTREDVAVVVSEWTKIPLKQLSEGETERLRKLEETLHKRVIGQEEAVAAVARAVRRGRIGLKDPARPIGSFLFLGPTGVGKTEICKALAEAVFGREDAMIRVDMSEYMEKHSVSKMIGSPPGYVGYEEGGQLSEKVRRNPYSVILFDEIEKAHPDIFNVLLQILDEGHVTDAQGRKVDFKNTILIMTSNAGASAIIEPKHLGFSAGESKEQDYERMKNGVMEEVRRIFKPEFLNRIDETIVFHALDQSDREKIASLMIRGLTARLKEQMGMELTVRKSVCTYIAGKVKDPKYGARPLKRMIQREIEDRLCEELLNGTISAKEPIVVTVRGDQICIQQKNKQKKNQ